MNKLIAGMCCALLAASPLAVARDKSAGDGKQATVKKAPTEKQIAHQKRMKDCSRQARDNQLKGDERKKFMSTCLKG